MGRRSVHTRSTTRASLVISDVDVYAGAGATLLAALALTLSPVLGRARGGLRTR
jgi:hypothetical protein